jgi:iron(III) transport system permease protein
MPSGETMDNNVEMVRVHHTERSATTAWARRTWERVAGGNAAAFFFAWLICVAVLAVSSVILWTSFNPGRPFELRLGLDNYINALDRSLFAEVIPNTIWVGLGTVATVLFFGFPLAWLLNRTNIPMRAFCISLIAVSVIVPGMVKAMGWIILLSPQVGLINQFLIKIFGLESAPFDINSLGGIAFIQGLMLTPTLFFLLSGPMRSMDPALEEAAAVSGANAWRSARWITLALLRPAVLGGIIYTFMTAIAIFEVPALLGGFADRPVLATRLYVAVRPPAGFAAVNYGIAGVYGLLITVPSLIALFFYFRTIQQSHRFAVVTGKGYRPKAYDLGRFRPAGLLFVLVYLSLAVFLPLLVLAWLSLLPSVRMPSAEALSLVTLKWYRDVFFLIGGFEVIRNTSVLVFMTSILVLFFSFMISWVVVRTRLPGRRAMDTIAMLPHAIPGLAFAFGLLIIGILAVRWLPGLPFYNTIWIMVAANLLNRLSYGTRITNAAFIQIGQELEDAAAVCGARKSITMLRIIVPLVGSALAFAGLWTALLVFREVSIPLLLLGPNNKVLSTQIWVLWESGHVAQASAVSVLLVSVMAVLLVVIQRLTGRIGAGQQLA